MRRRFPLYRLTPEFLAALRAYPDVMTLPRGLRAFALDCRRYHVCLGTNRDRLRLRRLANAIDFRLSILDLRGGRVA